MTFNKGQTMNHSWKNVRRNALEKLVYETTATYQFLHVIRSDDWAKIYKFLLKVKVLKFLNCKKFGQNFWHDYSK